MVEDTIPAGEAVDLDEDVSPDEKPSAVPLASVILWLPPPPKRARIQNWVVWALVICSVPLMIIGMEPWMRVLAAVIGVAATILTVVAGVRRRKRTAQCRPSHLTVGEGYLELRQGSGPAAQTLTWALTDVRSVRFKGAALGAGGDVIIAAADGTVGVMTGPPVDRTRRALRHARAAIRAQGFDLEA